MANMVNKPTLAQMISLSDDNTIANIHNNASDSVNDCAATNMMTPCNPHTNLKPRPRGDRFRRQGQAWFCTSGLPSDITIEIDEMIFHLHKFPLMSRSGKLSNLVALEANNNNNNNNNKSSNNVSSSSSSSSSSPASASDTNEHNQSMNTCRMKLRDMPGGPHAFEMVAKFCYSLTVELSPANVASLICAAHYLDMSEDYGENNLISLTDTFLNNIVMTSWKDCVTTLKSCESLLPLAEELGIVKKCVDSMVLKVWKDPHGQLVGWSKNSLQSPDGTLLWNGISTGAKPRRKPMMGWWYEDVTVLSFPFFKVVIESMQEKGLRKEAICGAIVHYAKKFIPGLANQRELNGNNHKKANDNVNQEQSSSSTWDRFLSINNDGQYDEEVLMLLESIENLLPMNNVHQGEVHNHNNVVPTNFLLGLLKIAMILNASNACKASLEKRIGMQLNQLTCVDDLLIPSYSHMCETLYDVECVERIMKHFIMLNSCETPSSVSSINYTSPNYINVRNVSRLLDEYLAEIASDPNLKPSKFRALVETLPPYAREVDDGLYRAIDIFIKTHDELSMTHAEKEEMCSVIDCQKLSLEACAHAAQNPKLPLRIVVQVLFIEQMQLRDAIMGCLDNGHHHKSLTEGTTIDMPCPPSATSDATSGVTQGPTDTPAPESLHLDIVALRERVAELERECRHLRNRLHRKASGWVSGFSSKLSCRNVSDATGPLAPPIGLQPHASKSSPRSNVSHMSSQKLLAHKAFVRNKGSPCSHLSHESSSPSSFAHRSSTSLVPSPLVMKHNLQQQR